MTFCMYAICIVYLKKEKQTIPLHKMLLYGKKFIE